MMLVANQLPLIKHLGQCDYLHTLQAMLSHLNGTPSCQIWVLEHHPVYTRGRRTLDTHIKHQTKIPIVDTDRGGQLTYHGPGQMIVYPIIHLETWHIDPKTLVDILENTTILALSHYQIAAVGDPKARGVYINNKKIASIGLKIKNGYSYHGIAINIDMDLSPFKAIVPCGDPNMTMTQLSDHAQTTDFKTLWLNMLLANLQKKRYTR